MGLFTYPQANLVKTDRLAHGRLDVKRLGALPILLEKEGCLGYAHQIDFDSRKGHTHLT